MYEKKNMLINVFYNMAKILNENYYLFESKITNYDFRIYPIVYDEKYNIYLWGFEKFIGVNTRRYREIYKLISDNKTFIQPSAILNDSDLILAHDQSYLDDLNNSKIHIADILKSFVIRLFPISIIRNKILFSFKLQASGSILAAFQSLQHNWAINLGGGLSIYNDVYLIIKTFWEYINENLKFLIIDLTPYSRCDLNYLNCNKTFIIDIFYYKSKLEILPHSQLQKLIELPPNIKENNNNYLDIVSSTLNDSLSKFKPDLIIYIAGTDFDNILRKKCLIVRDEIVFLIAKEKKIPITMLLGQGNDFEIISTSIENLFSKKIII